MHATKKTFFVPILAAILAAAGCVSTTRPAPLNEEGYFSTRTLIPGDGIIAAEGFRPEYRQLLYVKTDNTGRGQTSFYVKAFQNMNLFAKVMDKHGMEELVFELGLTDEVTSVSDRIGLHNLAKHIGTFLIVEPSSESGVPYVFVARLKAIDPESGEEVLFLENSAVNFVGLDKPLYYPLLNAFLEWARGEEISVSST